ncbi:hypothetical protein ACPW7J_11775 [Ihubacter sp. rT4E-8]|uniref:hypothetical protein n=1 Tax=unclassified Ihubacter TaxID=2633299 RepID=UPI00137AAF41
MKKIPYTFSTKSKQIFYFVIMFYFLLRLTVIVEMKLFQVEGYIVYLSLTLLYYAVIFAAVTFIFFGYKFFSTIYDDNAVTYQNHILRRSRTIQLSEIHFARLDTWGIHLFREETPNSNSKPALTIPFFRMGVIRAIPVNDFFELLIAQPQIKIEKKFKVLPGYTKKWQFISILYAFLAICMLLVCMTPLYTVIVLYQSFA